MSQSSEDRLVRMKCSHSNVISFTNRTILLSVFLACCCLCTVECRRADDWQDPNDIFGRSVSPCGAEHAALAEEVHLCKEELQDLRDAKGCRGPRVIKEPSQADRYLKRFINVLLASANFKHRKLGEGRQMKVNMDLQFSSQTLDVLQSFASDDRNGYSWNELDTSFLTLFEGHSSLSDDLLPELNDVFSFSDSNFHIFILIGVIGSVACSVLWIYFVSHSIKSTLFVGTVIVSSITFGWFWWIEIEDQKIMLLAKLSDGKDVNICEDNHTMLSLIWAKVTNQKVDAHCLEYLKAGNQSPFLRADMNRVFQKTMQAVAFSWLPALGSSLSGYFENLYGSGLLGSIAHFCSSIVATPGIGIFIVLICLAYFISRSYFRFKNWFFEVSIGNQQAPPVTRPEYSAAEQPQMPRLTEAVPEPHGLSNFNLSPPVSGTATKEKEGWRPFSRHYKKIKRSDTLPLPLLGRSLFDSASRIDRTPRIPYSAGSSQKSSSASKLKAEDKRFRNLRRSFSEHPLLIPDPVSG